MGQTIHVNGKSNSLAHKGSMGIAKSTLPDVCKTPSPGGPVPIPYPVIVSMSSDLKKGSKKVKFDGGNSAAIKGSEFSRCTGDEPGTAGGVKSSTNMKEATWILYSFDVKIEGKNACRLSDKMMMNHGNTACLAGFKVIPVYGGESPCGICGKADGHPIATTDETDSKVAERIDKAKSRLGDKPKRQGFMVAALKCLDPSGRSVTLFQSSGVGSVQGFIGFPKNTGPIRNAGGYEIPEDMLASTKVDNVPGRCAGPKAIIAANNNGFKPVGMTESWVGRRNPNFKEGDHAESCGTCKKLLPMLLCDQPPEG